MNACKAMGVAFGATVMCFASSAAWAQSSGGITYSRPPSADAPAESHSTKDRKSQLDPKRDTPESFATYQLMLAYGNCAARLGDDFVSGILGSPAESRTEKHDLVELQQRVSSCKRTGLTNIMSLQRGVLAEGMYLRENETVPKLPSYGAAKPEYQQFIDLEKERNHLRGETDQTMISATNCLVAQQPAIADRILRSEHGSDAEAREMDSLFAYASQCAGPTRPETLSRSFLRAFIADSMYHYARWKSQRESATKG